MRSASSKIADGSGAGGKLGISLCVGLGFFVVIPLARRKDRAENPHVVLVPGGKAGAWICGGLGFLVVLAGIFVSLVPPGDSANKLGFELKLVAGTVVSILIGLILYWRGARTKEGDA